jgi:ADP-heptose:LPS heptosyltransferase
VNYQHYPPNRILLIKPSSLGDVIHTLPVVNAIHQAWPKTEIRWLIHPNFKELIVDHPALGEPIPFPRDQFRGIIGGYRSLQWARTLRDWQPDLVLDLQGLLRSALMARCSGARHIIGLSDAREGASFFYSSIVEVDPRCHAVKRYMKVLEALGIPFQEPLFELPAGTIPAGFTIEKPFVVMHPYARGKGKNLTQEQVFALASSLKTIPVILVGKGEEMGSFPTNLIDWSGRTSLLELIALLRRASFVISSDSGPMHLAAALNPERLIAIHRWSDPLRVGPWPSSAFVWKDGKIQLTSQLTDELRPPGRTPTLEEMRELGRFVLTKIR